jgi:succinate dehydrogenase/fumarate reductase cytochrome b subunit
MGSGLKTLFIAAVLGLIVWNLGAGLYYMMVDKGQSDRTLKSLKRRIALSVGLIVLVLIGIATGIIKPHGVGQ